ncbi:EAL domain-containing protein [Vibrio splendidus]|uniref:EAL domain-containing protein n=1 Tax=Vibrio splendidus TaxID=29497 RepID=UPI000E327EAA|nr:cyclic diguanylate phosphodiesterase [Vibrio splendidus]
MFANKKTSPTTLVFLSFIPCVLALTFLYLNFGRSLDEQANQKAMNIVQEVDEILEFGKETNTSALKLLLNSNACEDEALALRHLVATIPYVRSANLAKDNVIFCTSIWGEGNYKYDPTAYTSGQLLLLNGSNVDTSHPLIVVRSTLDDHAALSGIDSLYLRESLTSGSKLRSFIAVGDKWLDSKELTVKTNPVEKLISWHQVSSKEFPYSAHAGFAYPNMLTAFWAKDKQYIVAIILLQTLFALYLIWLSRRPSNLYLEIERAMERKEFVPYAQPIVDSKTRTIQGIEILLRWKHPVQGIVRPDLFIPKAETSGLIVPMTHQLMRLTAMQIKPFIDKLPNGFHVGINISPQHCSKGTLLEACQEFIDIIDCDDITLVLELTEREALNYCGLTDDIFGKIKALGCKIAIDDFGTGHSSLVNLQKVDLDYLKIDQTFVRDIGVDTITGHLLQNMITLSHDLSLDVIAEGVETEQQADYLRERSVSYLQGFLFAKPIPLEEFLNNEMNPEQRAE